MRGAEEQPLGPDDSAEAEPLSLARTDAAPFEAASDSEPPPSRAPSSMRFGTSRPTRVLDDDEPTEDHEADPLIGMVIADRYRIIELIGRGGMGIVYRVEHVRIGKLLAMKLLAGELSQNKDVVRRFKQEALTVSRLSSPYTVQVFDYGVWQHLTYLVMELVTGQDLGRLLRREGPLPFERVGRLMLQVCASLQEAHDKGIVHRDIKPENIMVVPNVDGHEVAKVCDFGLAKLRESSELNEVTLQGSVVGTPYYICPEQVLGEEVDGRSDLYSLGAVMFRALTGEYPFEANTPMAMFTKHLTEPPPRPTERIPELVIPKTVDDAVHRCMAKDAEDRLQGVGQLRDLILRELDGAGMSKHERMWLGVDDQAAASVAVADVTRTGLFGQQLATRAELERYERKLRRTRYSAYIMLGALLVVAGVLIGLGIQRGTEAFTGLEAEPNNTRDAANPLPLERDMRGKLGRRIDSSNGDRDFFKFVLPGGQTEQSLVRLSATALPNIATCSVLFRAGYREAVARYCVGYPGQDLVVPAVRLVGGEYYLVLTQDLEQEGRPPYVYENVSDSYRVRVGRVSPAAHEEIEPNDRDAIAQQVEPGSEVVGTLPWRGDEDVYCAPSSFQGALRWEIRDDGRPAGTVLEFTPLASGTPGPVMRIHGAKSKPFNVMRLPADVNSPFSSPSYPVEHGERCVRLRLTADPWVRPGARFELRADATIYRLSLQTVQP